MFKGIADLTKRLQEEDSKYPCSKCHRKSYQYCLENMTECEAFRIYGEGSRKYRWSELGQDKRKPLCYVCVADREKCVEEAYKKDFSCDCRYCYLYTSKICKSPGLYKMVGDIHCHLTKKYADEIRKSISRNRVTNHKSKSNSYKPHNPYLKASSIAEGKRGGSPT